MLSVEGYMLKLAFGCEFNTAEAKMISAVSRTHTWS